MRTTIIGLVTALAVTAGAVQPASAQTSAIMSAQLSTEAFSSNSTDPESELSNGSSSESSTDATESDPGSSDSELTAVIGVLAVAGLIAGGLYWAVQQHIIPNPLPGIIPGPPAPQSAPAPANNYVYYKNCAAVRAAGKAPLYRGQPGYEAPRLDRDHDGIACE